MTSLAKRYAAALFSLGYDPAELHLCAQAVSQTDILAFFTSPAVPVRQKTEAVRRVFGARVGKNLSNLLQLLAEKGRMELLPGIEEQCRQLALQAQSGRIVQLFCVTPPSDEQLEKLREFIRRTYQTSQVELQIVQDSSLVGGIILKVGDDVYDKSVRGQLQSLRQSLRPR